jgi:signal peptide peptidase SppA
MPAPTIDMSQRLYNRPLMIDEQLADMLKHGHANQSLIIDNLSDQATTMWASVYAGERKPYRMEESVAIIPVNGTLYHKVDWQGYSYTGYDFITRMIDYALKDSDVQGIVLDINSGGGEVDGAFEAAAKIRSANAEKPILALVNAHAYSAAYLLASAAGKIVVTKTGGVGSVGVVTAHVDYSKMLDKAGIDVTLLYKGSHKVDGNPYEPLSKEVKDRIDSRLEATYTLFVDTVAINRSVSAQVIRDTEALTYGADEALSLGLVDSVLAPDDALAAFVAEQNGKQWGNIMTATANTQQTTTQAESGNEASKVVITQAQVESAKADGMKEGATAERARIMGIMGCEEAKGRESLAHVLCEQGLTVEGAKTILAASPKAQEASASNTNGFDKAMNTTANPEMTTEKTGGDEAAMPAWQKAIKANSALTGAEYKIN